MFPPEGFFSNIKLSFFIRIGKKKLPSLPPASYIPVNRAIHGDLLLQSGPEPPGLFLFPTGKLTFAY
jgi:hypothetical protein